MKHLFRTDLLNLRGVELDNVIYELQNSNELIEREIDMLLKADVAFLQDEEAISAGIIYDLIWSIRKRAYPETIGSISGEASEGSIPGRVGIAGSIPGRVAVTINSTNGCLPSSRKLKKSTCGCIRK